MTDSGEKDQLVQGYKEHLSTKDCMHFNRWKYKMLSDLYQISLYYLNSDNTINRWK